MLNTLPYHLLPIGVAWDEAFNRLGITIIPAGPGNSELQTRIIHDLKVTGYAGTPSFLMTIIRRAEELEDALSRFPAIYRFQAVVDRVTHRDELTLNIEPGEEVDREKLLQGLHKAIQET